jgi:hypothetical protein
MSNLLELNIEYVDEMPYKINTGILYVSEKYHTAIHLCACGCGVRTVTPLGNGEWSLSKNDSGKVTLRPSIGNWAGTKPYHAHYYITDNKIEWL